MRLHSCRRRRAQTELPDGALLTKETINFAADFAAAPNQFLNPDGMRDRLNVDLCGALAQLWTKEPQRFTVDPLQQMPGLNG